LETSEDKRLQIIKVALKRFAHFGISKTTMNEIADDSAISKANIYYYFPDKFAVIAAVVEELVKQYDVEIKNRLKESTSALTSLQLIQLTKKDFFEKYYMLHISEGFDAGAGNERLKSLSKTVNEYETSLIVTILEKGISNGELNDIDSAKTAQLYVEMLKGIILVNKHCSSQSITMDQQLLNKIHQKQLRLIEIFMKGLSKI